MKRSILDKALRFFLLVFLLPTLLFALRSVGPGAGLLVSAAACGGSAGGASGEGGAGVGGDGSAFSTGAPVDIPSPIAKGIEGVDPTSITFTRSSGESGIGTVSMETVGGIDATIALIRSGEIFQRVETSNGRAEFEIGTDMQGEALAFVVEGEAEFEESVSAPVIVRVDDNGVMQILVTNSGTIESQQIAVSSAGRVAFSARNSSDAPLVAVTDVDGGVPEILTDGISNTLGQLAFADDGTLYGIDAVSGFFAVIDGEGSVTMAVVSTDLPVSSSHFTSAPDGFWMIHSGGTSSAVILILMSHEPGNFQTTDLILDGAVITDISFDWMTDDQLAVARQLSTGSYEMQVYSGLEAVRENLATPVTVMNAKTSSRTMANPSADRQNGNRFVFECEDSAGNTDLCLIASDGTDSVLVNRTSGSVAHARFAPDGSYVVYEALASTDGECEGQLIVYNMNDGTDRIIANDGCFPAPYPSDPNVIAYLSPVGGKLQVGIENLENSEAPTDVTDDDVTGTATAILIGGESSTLSAGICTPFSLRGVDASGDEANITAGTTVTFTDSGNGTFYSDADCTAVTNTITFIATFSDEYPFYFLDNTVETTTLNITGDGLTGGTLAVTVE